MVTRRYILGRQLQNGERIIWKVEPWLRREGVWFGVVFRFGIHCVKEGEMKSTYKSIYSDLESSLHKQRYFHLNI
jgi:hypothetical protein